MSLDNNYNHYYLDLDGVLTEKQIDTSKDEILTMRIAKIPTNEDYVHYGSIDGDTPKSLICTLAIEGR